MIALLLLMIVKMGTVPILIMGTVPIFSDTVTIRLHSRIMNEERTLYVSLPEDYEMSRDSYPVLYVLDADGRSLFPNSVSVVRDLTAKSQCPDMILIGIWNTQRNRDMIPQAVSHRPGSGGSKIFLSFIQDELKPFVKNNYRATDFSILYGMSNSALFAVYSLCEQPDAFEAYIASSPMIGHCPEFITQKAEGFVRMDHSQHRVLFMIYGSEDSARVTNFAPALHNFFKSQASEYLTSHLEILAGEGHVPKSSLSRGLMYIFSRGKS